MMLVYHVKLAKNTFAFDFNETFEQFEPVLIILKVTICTVFNPVDIRVTHTHTVKTKGVRH